MEVTEIVLRITVTHKTAEEMADAYHFTAAQRMQLAELVDIDRSHISAIELGNVGVSLDVIFRLCEVLEITPKELFDFR